MKKKLITSTLLLGCALWASFLYYAPLGANTSNPIPELECSYASKFERCVVANRTGSSRTIEDFACIASNDYNVILDQIILDEKFEEIQDKQLSFLAWLLGDKEKALTEPLRIIDDVTKNFAPEWVFSKEYQELCNGWLLAERLSCTDPISNTAAGERIADWGLKSECMQLANSNLETYSQVAYDIMKKNKSEVLQDKTKEYFQQENTKYDEILSTMGQIIGHTERINPTHYVDNPKQ